MPSGERLARLNSVSGSPFPIGRERPVYPAAEGMQRRATPPCILAPRSSFVPDPAARASRWLWLWDERRAGKLVWGERRRDQFERICRKNFPGQRNLFSGQVFNVLRRGARFYRRRGLAVPAVQSTGPTWPFAPQGPNMPAQTSEFFRQAWSVWGREASRGESRRRSWLRWRASSYGVRVCQQRYMMRCHLKAIERKAQWCPLPRALSRR